METATSMEHQTGGEDESVAPLGGGRTGHRLCPPRRAARCDTVCRDGVLTVTVEKLPPPEPKKPKTIEVKVA